MAEILQMPGEKLDFDPILHAYLLGSQSIPSVTDVIHMTGIGGTKVLHPVAIRRIKAKGRLGKHVHKATEMVDQKILDWDTVAAKEVPYVLSYEKAAKYYGFKIRMSEQSMVGSSAAGPYGMTVDRVLDITAGEEQYYGTWVIDLKNACKEEKEWKVQTAAYKWGVIQNHPNMEMTPGETIKYGRPPLRRGVLHLKPDGRIGKLIPYDDEESFDIFMYGLGIVHWRLRQEGIGFDKLLQRTKRI